MTDVSVSAFSPFSFVPYLSSHAALCELQIEQYAHVQISKQQHRSFSSFDATCHVLFSVQMHSHAPCDDNPALFNSKNVF